MDENNPNDSSVDDYQLPPSLFLSDLAIPPDWNDEDLSLFDLLNNDTNHSNALADGSTEDKSDGISGLDVAQSQLFHENISDLVDNLIILPTNNSVQDNSSSMEGNPNTSSVVKSSETMNTTNFINGDEVIRTGGLLQLTETPLLYQRVRYENESNQALRYIFVPNDGSLTLQVSNLQSIIPPGMSPFVRITRTTVPYGPNNLILCHPYPIWLNDKDGKVHNGSLFIRRTGETIEIKNLVLIRSKQDPLAKTTQFPIFTSQQLDFNSFHLTNISSAKKLIDKYDLRHSILHFQIFLVDQNNKAYATDLECQTEAIYEFEAVELQHLPLHVRNLMKKQTKRKQTGHRKECSIKTYKKKITKKHSSG